MLDLNLAQHVRLAPLALALLLGAAANTATAAQSVTDGVDASTRHARRVQAETAGSGRHAMTEAPIWAALDDAVLPTLIERALQANTDVRQAMARLQVARFRQQADGTSRLPDDELAYQRWSGEAVDGPYAASVAWNWEVDLFGRLKAARSGSRARGRASAAEFEGVRVMVVAEVARAWFQLRGAREAAAARLRHAMAQAEIVELTRTLAEEGLLADADLARSRAEAAIDLADGKAARDTVFALEARLAVLLGEEPGSWNAPESPPMLAIDPPPADPPDAETSPAMQPDLQAAAHRLVAQEADAKAAAASRYPRLHLGGIVALLSGNLSGLFSGSQQTRGQGGAISWGLFDQPRLRAEQRAAEATVELVRAQYDAAWLTALEDTEVALQRHRTASSQLGWRQRAFEHLQVAESAALARFEEGHAPYLDALLARRASIDAELAMIDALVAQREASIDVVRALYALPEAGVGQTQPSP